MVIPAVSSLIATLIFWLGMLALMILLVAGMLVGARHVLIKGLERMVARREQRQLQVFQQRVLETQNTQRGRIQATIHQVNIKPTPRERIEIETGERHA